MFVLGGTVDCDHYIKRKEKENHCDVHTVHVHVYIHVYAVRAHSHLGNLSALECYPHTSQ